jgi:low affinity Fe/Cu permease
MDKLFAKIANAMAKATGSPVAFLLCVAAVVIWPQPDRYSSNPRLGS